jgi:diphosphomevalonate decarboxylase
LITKIKKKKGMKATAFANINIALTKYWGKRDEKLILPHNSSISITYDGYGTTTTVEFNKEYSKDIFILDNKKYENEKEYDRVVNQLDLTRKLAKFKLKAKVISQNQVVTAAGMASSASGAAALSLASVTAAGLKLSQRNLSILARQGSGSATRSILGGFVKWEMGKKINGLDSFARQIANEQYWSEFRMIAVLVNNSQKKVKSRAGMAATIKTCPYYEVWKKTVIVDNRDIEKAIKAKDFSKIGEIAEHNCLKMHALMMTTKPALLYWTAETLSILHSVYLWREQGLETYFTIDAGANVNLICLKKDVDKIKNKLSKLLGINKVIELKVGKGVHLLDKHLF